MANIVSSNPNISGTANADTIIGVGTIQTIDGGAGNDVIFGDHDEVFQDFGAGNNTIAAALDIDSSTLWSTEPNPDIGNFSVPYTTILAEGAGEFDYFKVTVGAGETITLDIDYGIGSTGGQAFDSIITLRDGTDTQIPGMFNDDAGQSLGGFGSFNQLDSYLTYTNTSGSSQIYYIRMEQLGSNSVPSGATYMLNVSVGNHATANSVASAVDTITGGTGNDVLYGLGGNDNIDGGGDDDLIEGGLGGDTLNGGAGVDTLSYSASSAGVTINLKTALASGGDAAGDAISNFESLIGSAFGDTLVGSAANNIIEGGDGNDFLNGLGGTDKLYGGNGNDEFAIVSTDDTINEVYNGGAGNDQISFYGFGLATTINLRDDLFASIEAMVFNNQSATNPLDVQIRASQFLGSVASVSASVDAGHTNTLSIFIDTPITLDLSMISFTGFSEAADGVYITGDGDDEVITGSSVRDTIVAGGGNDMLIIGAGIVAGETYDGGAGSDALFFNNRTEAYTINLQTGVFNLVAGGAASTVSNIETVYAGAGNDVLVGGKTLGVAFQLYGGGGDDRVGTGTAGTFNGETYDGGAGTDTLDFANLFNGYRVNLTTQEMDGISGGKLVTASGFENIDAGQGDDNLTGDGGVNIINAGAGNDTLNGGAGGDALNGGAGYDTASYAGAAVGITANLNVGIGAGGDAAGDTYTSIEALIGSAFGDTLVGNHALINYLAGGGGDDALYGVGLDVINGGAGNDVFFGGAGGAININMNTVSIETVWGSVLGDTFDGSTATVALVMIGQGGADTMTGGSGDDFLYFDNLDTVIGGAGNDWAVASNSAVGVTLDLNASGFENAWGSTKSDVFTAAGSMISQVMVGDAGDDDLTGGDVADYLYGFSGSDFLNGGLGNDNLTGGAGNDRFIYNSTSWGVDTIWDFTGGSDIINMAGSGFTDFSQLTINIFGSNSVIVSGSDAIWVLNDITLDASDFSFV